MPAVTPDPMERLRSVAIDTIAKLCHEANRAICEAAGDFTQKPWADAAEWQRASAREGVAFALANPNATPEDQHNAWVDAKLGAGWVYGETKDPEAKTHPCIRPYGELPFEQRVKDHVFRAIVRTILALGGPDAPPAV